MCNYFRQKYHPAIFQGSLKKKHYFEGWYCKIVDEKSENVYAIIPGISLDRKTESHAFIQIINGKTSETYYVEYKIEEFSFSKKDFQIRIGKNIFSEKGMQLNIHHKDISIEGEIVFGDLTPWPVTTFSPGAMGWYAFVPFMECYHGVVSFNHSLNGKLNISGKECNFDGGKGYIEKDWGKSFPEYYIWIQSNHFEKYGVSLMASFAKIPFLHKTFDGFVIGFQLEDKLYRFTTYTGAKIKKLNTSADDALIHVSDKRHRLELKVHRLHPPGELKSPQMGGMVNRIHESLNAIVNVRLIDLQTNKILYEGQGSNTGYEMGGKIELIKQV